VTQPEDFMMSRSFSAGGFTERRLRFAVSTGKHYGGLYPPSSVTRIPEVGQGLFERKRNQIVQVQESEVESANSLPEF